MEENEVVTEVMDEEIEYIDNEDDSTGIPVIPAAIGAGLLALGGIAVAKRKKIAAFIEEKRVERAQRILDEYNEKSFLYEDLNENKKGTDK